MSQGHAGRIARHFISISILGFLAAAGCSKASLDYRQGGANSEQFLTDNSVTVVPTGDTTPTGGGLTDPTGPLVCNPFGNPGGDATHGLQGTFYYDNTCKNPPYTDLADYFANGVKLPYDVFLKNLEFPPIHITGFTTNQGQTVTTGCGDPVQQYYAADFLSNLRLQDSDPEGDYQLALLNDDGGEILVGDGVGNYSPLVTNDGVHNPSLACSTATIHLTHGMSVPIKVLMFQAAEWEVTFLLLWRHVDASTSLADATCGVTGAVDLSDWFGAHASNYEASLTGAGWTSPANGNYLLSPSGQATNACAMTSGGPSL